MMTPSFGFDQHPDHCTNCSFEYNP
jgi:hypothetical protein